MYEIDLQTIHFSNGKKHSFPTEIAETMDFEESIIVRLASQSLALIENIFALDYHGNFLWKIPTPRSFTASSPYVSLFRHGMFLEVLNWDGHLVTLHPKEGRILSEGYYSMGSSHQRAPSQRQWM